MPIMDIIKKYIENIEKPSFQSGGKKKPIYVDDKNDPRYKAYQDSLKLFNSTERIRKMIDSENMKKEPVKRKGTLSYNQLKTKVNNEAGDSKVEYGNVKQSKGWWLDYENKAPIGEAFYNMERVKIKPYAFDWESSDIGADNLYRALYKKPQQPILLQQKEEEVKDTPQVTPLQQIQTKGIVESDFSLQPIEVNIPQFAPTPKSFDIEYSAQRMNDSTGYYDQNNVQGVDIETALRAQEQADRMNQYWQEKYGNSQNPKAQERLKQLKDNVKITPNYQMGGEFTENEKKFLDELAKLKLI